MYIQFHYLELPLPLCCPLVIQKTPLLGVLKVYSLGRRDLLKQQPLASDTKPQSKATELEGPLTSPISDHCHDKVTYPKVSVSYLSYLR